MVPEHYTSPASYGVQLHAGIYHELIRYNTRLPCTATETFETAQSHLTSAKISVACSQSPLEAPRRLAEIELAGIQIAEAGIPKARVTMQLDEHLKGGMTIRDLVTGTQGHCEFRGDIFVDCLT